MHQHDQWHKPLHHVTIQWKPRNSNCDTMQHHKTISYGQQYHAWDRIATAAPVKLLIQGSLAWSQSGPMEKICSNTCIIKTSFIACNSNPFNFDKCCSYLVKLLHILCRLQWRLQIVTMTLVSKVHVNILRIGITTHNTNSSCIALQRCFLFCTMIANKKF